MVKLPPPRQVAIAVIGALFITVFSFNLLLPSDNTFRSMVRFNWQRTQGYFRTPLNEQQWIFDRQAYPVSFHDDVGLLIKTGYGTQERVLSQMEAMGLEGSRNAVIVVGNFNGTLEDRSLGQMGVKVDVVDIVGRVLSEDKMQDFAEEPRARQYHELHNAIQSGDEAKAREISKESGWDMDALKFIPGLELAYEHAPYRKWWIIIDDDTFLVKSSIVQILSHLDPAKDQYIGNAIGDYRGRFAHGGSAIAISGRTLQHLIDHPDVIQDAKIRAMTETWGDRLVATTLMKLGIYLNEQFTSFFNGEGPRFTKITADNYCLPVASFHGLSDPNRMHDFGELFKERQDLSKIIFYSGVWSSYQQPEIRFFGQHPIQPGNHDHVGNPDGPVTTIENVPSAMDCVKHCDQPWNGCLSWTWEQRSLKCHLAQWMIVGERVEGRQSGLHYPRAKDIGDRCKEMQKKMHWT